MSKVHRARTLICYFSEPSSYSKVPTCSVSFIADASPRPCMRTGLLWISLHFSFFFAIGADGGEFSSYKGEFSSLTLMLFERSPFRMHICLDCGYKMTTY